MANGSNQRIRFNGVEGMLSSMGLVSLAIGTKLSLEYYDNFKTFMVPWDHEAWKYVGAGAVATMAMAFYRLGRRHGTN